MAGSPRQVRHHAFKQVLQPAIDYATEGFPVSERIAHDWVLPKAENSPLDSLPGCCKALDPDSVKAWYIHGSPPKAGQIFRNLDLAKSFELLQKEGRNAFYTGPSPRPSSPNPKSSAAP